MMTIAEIETIRRALDTEVSHKEYVKNVTEAKIILNKYENLQASQDQSKLLLADVIKRYNLDEDLEQDVANAIELGYKMRNGGIPSAKYDEYDELREMIVDKFL